MQQIEETERLIAVYRNAEEVIVGTQDQIYSRRGLINRTTFTAAEIGGQIVSILGRREIPIADNLEIRRGPRLFGWEFVRWRKTDSNHQSRSPELRYLSKKDESPKVQPEAVAAGFEDKRNPRDIAAGSDRLIRLGAGEVRISPTFLMS